MSKSNATELDFLKYTFQAVAISWDASTNLFVSLHTADPGDAGDQTTSESAYTGYTRVTVSRSTSAWTTSGATLVDNLASITFPACTGGTSVITYAAVGTAFSGAGQLLYSGALTASLTVSNGITPVFDTSSLTISED